MKIIDIEIIKDNTLRFYLGKKSCANYRGDNWNNTPYEQNAGIVYNEFVEETRDIIIPNSVKIIRTLKTPYCKNDFKHNTIPFITLLFEQCGLAVPYELYFNDSEDLLDHLEKTLYNYIK